MTTLEEKEIILWSPYPSQQIPNISVGEYFVNRVSQFEDRIIIYDAKTDKTLTAKQLLDESHSIAVALLNRGIVKSDRILLFSENLIEYAITQFAIYLLGNAFTYCKKDNGSYELSEQIKDSGVNVIFTSLKNASITEKALEIENIGQQIKLCVTFDGKHSDYLQFSDLQNYGFGKTLEKVPHFPIDLKNDICMIGYTSGTTGLPKGAIWTHYAFLRMVYTPDFVWNAIQNNQIIACLSNGLSHASGIYWLTKFLLMGSSFVLIDLNTNEDLFKAIDKYKITRIHLNLSIGQQLMNSDIKTKYDLSSLKIMHYGGTPLPSHLIQSLIDKYNIQSLTVGYGMTEYTPITLTTDREYIPGSCGHLAPDTQLKVRDTNTDQSLGPNQLGELCVRGRAMFTEYLNNPKATKDTIDENGWLYTGDVSYYDENGRIFIKDRIKELIKYSIHSVYPAEIGEFLLSNQAIEDAAVVGVPHAIDNQRIRAYIVVKSNKQLTENEISKFVSDNMGPRNHIRDGVVFVDRIRRTLIGKVDRKYYRQLVSN